MRLPVPTRSQAILLGVSTYQSSELSDVPAVSNNLDRLAEVLTDAKVGGFASERCLVLSEPNSVRATYRMIRNCADRADDTLLVYFSGHGLIGPRRGGLYLALADTEPEDLLVSALSYDLIRDVFLNCSADNRVLVLDCCFSGRATRDFLAAPREAVLGELEIAGTYVLASAPPNAVSLAPPGATHTSFTGELLSLLTKGIPDGPELITLGTTYRHLRRTMTAKGLPRPGQRGTDTADLLALTRNPACLRDEAPDPIEMAPDAPGKAGTNRLSGRRAVAAALTIVGILILTTHSTRSNNQADSAKPQISQTQATGQAAATTTTSKAYKTLPSTLGFDPRTIHVWVYNNATNADAGKQAAVDFDSEGWPATFLANYHSNITKTTVYYRPGTEEKAAAIALAKMFSIHVEPRSAGLANSQKGLIVVVADDYHSPKI